MNMNAIIALLELKGIITRAEGEKLVEFLANKPQSTMLADAVDQVKELVTEVKQTGAQILEQAKPVIEAAKEEVGKVAEEAKTEVQKVALEAAADVKADVKKATDTAAKK